MFGDTDNSDRPDRDRFQAIVPAYTFQCSGRVTEWRACVQPGGFSGEQYYIQFQVWRSTGIEGCYDLVGYNTPLDAEGSVVNSVVIIGTEGFLSPPRGNDDPLDLCVVLPVTESQQIEFQSGDVIGYYVDHFTNGQDRNDGGIQWIESEEEDEGVVVYYRDELPREDIKSKYAIGISNIDPSVCDFPTNSSNLYSLSNAATKSPIINLSIGEYMMYLTLTVILFCLCIQQSFHPREHLDSHHLLPLLHQNYL